MRNLGLGDDAVEPLRGLVNEDPAQVDAACCWPASSNGKAPARRSSVCSSDSSTPPKTGATPRRLHRSRCAWGRSWGRRTWWPPATSTPERWSGIRTTAISCAPSTTLASDTDATVRGDIMERLLALESGPDAERLALDLAALRTEAWDEEGVKHALRAGYKAYPASRALRERLESAYRERGASLKLAALLRDALAGSPDDTSLLLERASLLARGGDPRPRRKRSERPWRVARPTIPTAALCSHAAPSCGTRSTITVARGELRSGLRDVRRVRQKSWSRRKSERTSAQRTECAKRRRPARHRPPAVRAASVCGTSRGREVCSTISCV